MKEMGQFTCYIIGSGTLPIRCAEILMRKGHVILGIISSDLGVGRWAREKKLNHLEPVGNLETLFHSQPFDYLFSIVNEHILREDVLRLPRKLAINYHDALLPRYAGTHATSWALMNGETSHGITWHVISDVVDAGDILKQQRVEIAEYDTALALNTKCYEAAINAFTELVEELSTGSTAARKQNPGERTYFPRYKRPVNGCVISWDNRASDISALVRALNFGPHPNPFGSPKLAVKNDFITIPELEVLKAACQAAAGTINQIGLDFLRVSTADREVVLRKALILDGRSISIPDLVARFNLHEGYQFTDLHSETAKRLEAHYATNCKHEKFWVKKLAALEPAVPPYSISTTASNLPRHASVPMRIPDEVLTFLKERQPEFSAGDLLLAAYGALLARLGGVDSFDIGYKDSELQNEIAGLENFFATQLPLRIDVDCLQSFTELLKAVKEQIESVKKHKTYAHDLVTRYPQLRTAADSGNKFALPVIVEKVKRLDDRDTMSDGEITLVISESESECRWIYDQERVANENIGKLIRHFTTLLIGIVANPECQVAYLPVLTEKERHQLLLEWNNSCAEYPQDQCVHQLVAARAKEFPDAVAVVCGDQRLSYAQLNERSNQLGHHLRRLGVGPDRLVAICMERSVESVIGLLGILKAGGAYLPLDPAYPRERLSFMLEDAGVAAVLTQQRLKSILPQHHAKVLCLDTNWAPIASESAEDFDSGATAGNLAYVIYTSGSTGKPKGVELEHSGLVNLVTWHQLIYGLTPTDRATLLAGPAFDASVWELWPYLATGASIHIPHGETRATASKLIAWLAQKRITICFLPTPMAEEVLEQRMPGDLVLRALLTGGDRLHRVPPQSLPFKLINHYGPTESTVVTTFGVVERTSLDGGAPPIGRPIANTRVYLLDRYLQPVPVGIPGEIYIGGDGLARGYRNLPDLTAERFITHSFGYKSDERLYKTGDLARYLPGGEIDFVDRIDNQVKIRGFRIELGEIETVLLAHTAVRETVAIAREDQSGEKRLIAYLVWNQEQPMKIGELRSYLKQKLPDYMVPSAFVELDRLPLTPNGKIDIRALPVPSSTISRTEAGFVAHRDDLELRLTKIWEEILGLHPVGITDNFFDLGGHSLQAVRMFADVEATFGKSIPLATLLQSPTIEALAQILRQDDWTAPESSLVPIQANGSNPPFFCIHAKGGNVLFYRDLARYLGNDQPFYGLQARRLAGRQIGHSTVEEMAEYYIKEIQTLQPEGPYFLGGSSFGGLAAYEMAQQLLMQGHKVALLALLDTGTPDYPRLLPGSNVLRSKVYDFVRRVQHHRDSLKLLNSQERVEYVLEKAEKVRRKYRRKLNNKYREAGRKFYSMRKRPLPKSFIQVEDKLWKAGQVYVPKAYPGKVTLFRARVQPLGIYPDPTLGWGRLAAGGLEIHEVPGHHGSIIAEPYVRALAQELTHCIERVLEPIRAQTIFSPPNHSEIVDSNLRPDRKGSRKVFGIATSGHS